MKRVLQIISGVGLIMTIAPAVLVFGGRLAWTEHAAAMLVGAALWFLSAPFWMREQGGSSGQP